MRHINDDDEIQLLKHQQAGQRRHPFPFSSFLSEKDRQGSLIEQSAREQTGKLIRAERGGDVCPPFPSTWQEVQGRDAELCAR